MSDSPLKNYAIGVVVFTLIITSGIFLIDQLATENPTYIDTNNDKYQTLASDLNQADEAISIGNNFGDGVETSDGSGGGDGSFSDSLIGGSWKTIQGYRTSYNFMTGVYESAAKMFNVPPFVVNAIIAIISIIIAFAIFSAIFQRKL